MKLLTILQKARVFSVADYPSLLFVSMTMQTIPTMLLGLAQALLTHSRVGCKYLPVSNTAAYHPSGWIKHFIRSGCGGATSNALLSNDFLSNVAYVALY